MTSLNFEELLELREQINNRLRELDSEYDYILTNGDYFVGMDIPKGRVMFYRLRSEDDENTIFVVHDRNDEYVGLDGVSIDHPRIRYVLEDEYKIEIKRGPIGIKYLDD